MKMKLLTLAAALAATTGLHAATPTEPTPVNVECTAKEPIGLQVCTALRDTFARSPRYKLVGDEEKVYRWNVRVVAIDIDNEPTTAFSWTLTGTAAEREYFFRSGVMACGINKVASCASSTMADVDNSINDILK